MLWVQVACCCLRDTHAICCVSFLFLRMLWSMSFWFSWFVISSACCCLRGTLARSKLMEIHVYANQQSSTFFGQSVRIFFSVCLRHVYGTWGRCVVVWFFSCYTLNDVCLTWHVARNLRNVVFDCVHAVISWLGFVAWEVLSQHSQFESLSSERRYLLC